MKRFILSAVLLASIIACSTDENASSETSTVNIPTKGKLSEDDVAALKEEIYAISLTGAWTDWQSKTQEFANKINYKKLRIETRDEFITWIDNNLGSTQFSSKEDGIALFDDMLSKSGTLVTENIDFFNALGDADPEQLVIIMEPVSPDFPVETNSNSCMDLCGIFAQFDTDQAYATYYEHLTFVSNYTNHAQDYH